MKKTPARKPKWISSLRLHRLGLVGLLGLALGIGIATFRWWLPIEPHSLGVDWRVFYSAATIIRHGGSPYSSLLMHTSEQTAWFYPGSQSPFDLYYYLPIVGLLLVPLTFIPFWASFVVWTCLGISAAGWALWAWLRDSGWQRPGVWVLGGLSLFLAIRGYAAGQLDAIMLAGTIGGLIAMRRNQPWWAGIAMFVVLLKPDLLWPLPLLFFAGWSFDWKRAWKFALAGGTTLIVLTVLGFLFVPGSGGFFSSFVSLESMVGNIESEMAGLPLLFAKMSSGHLIGDGIAAFGCLAVFGLAALSFKRFKLSGWTDRERALIPSTGLAIWLVCTTYVHPNDQILVLPLLALLLGYGGRLVDGRWITGAVLLCAGVLLAYSVAPLLAFGALLGMVVLEVLYRKRLPEEAWVAQILVATVIFPVNNIFTPVAVAGVALGGIYCLWVKARLEGDSPQRGLDNDVKSVISSQLARELNSSLIHQQTMLP